MAAPFRTFGAKGFAMIVVTDEMIAQASKADKDLKMEMAVALYASKVFDLRKAAEYAGVFPWMNLAAEVKMRCIEPWDAMTAEDFEQEWNDIQRWYRR